MAVSLIKPPNPLSFSADIINAGFLCTDILSQAGVLSVNEIDCSLGEGGVPGSMVIKYGSQLIEMSGRVLEEDLDDSGTTYLRDNAGTAVIGLRKNYFLNRDFEIAQDVDKIIFTARKFGAGFDFLVGGSGANTIQGKSELKKPNYTILFSLWLENSDNTGFENIYTTNLQLLPGSGKIEAPIGDKLHVAITDAVRKYLPELPSTTMQCKNSCRRYYFEYAESYGEPPLPRERTVSETFTVLHGGMSSIGQFSHTAESFLFPGAPENDRFLRQGDRLRFARTSQPEFLYFFNNREERELVLRAEYFPSDGSGSSVHDLYSLTMLAKRKYAFDITFNNTYDDFLPGKAISHFNVFLCAGSEVVSEVRTIWLDYTKRNFIRYFHNWSSLGSMDTRVCYGKGESEFELFSSSVSRLANDPSELQKGHSYTFSSRLKRSFRVATGWLTKRELQLNADFFLSDMKYRAMGTILLPIEVLPGKISEIKDGENLTAQLFEYSYQFEDHAYTEGDSDNAGISTDNFSPNGAPTTYYPSLSGNLADEVLQRLARLEQENLIDGNGY